MKKRILPLVLSFAMILTGAFGSVTAFAASTETPQISAYAGDSIDTATAITFGNTYSGTISAENTGDFYKITLPESGKITLAAQGYMEYVTYKITDSSGSSIFLVNKQWDSATKVSNVNVSYHLTKGTYYISVSRYWERNGNYNFNVTYTGADETFTETGSGNNNALPEANVVNLGTTYKGQIAKNDNQDIYKFTLPESGRLTLSSTAQMEYATYVLSDSTGKKLWSTNANWDATIGMIVRNDTFDLTKGTYYLTVARYWDRTGNYSFNLKSAGSKESFAETGEGTNNEFSTANSISINKTYRLNE